MRRRGKLDPLDLYIATKSVAIAAMFKDSHFGGDYGAQIRRHKLVAGGNGVEVRMAMGRPRCQKLDWAAFRALYLDDAVEPDGGDVPF